MDGVLSSSNGGGRASATPTPSRPKAPNSPSKSAAAAKNKRRREKEKRAQAASEPEVESTPAPGLEVARLTPSEAQPSSARSTPLAKTAKQVPRKVIVPPPPPPLPLRARAQLVAAHVDRICMLAIHTVADVLRGTLSVIGFVFVVLQKPIAVVLTIWVLVWLLTSQLIPKIESLVLAPICSAPIISGFVPFCHQRKSAVSQADYSQLVELQSRLSEVIELNLAGDTSLAFSIRKSEVAIRDLTTQVRVSDLASKDALVGRLEIFVAEANDATRGLSRLAARVGGSIDTILAMDSFTIKRLEAIESGTSSFLSLPYDIIPQFSGRSKARQRQELARTFESASETTATQLQRLVTEAEVTLAVLNRLDASQDTLHEMILMEKRVVDRDRDELMAQLWTILGQNRNERKMFDEHHSLLAELGRYRRSARDRVKATMDQLIQLSEDLSDLRDRVAQPAMIGADAAIPLEVHLDSLRRGVERLGSFRQKGLDRENQQLRNLLVEPVPHDRRIP